MFPIHSLGGKDASLSLQSTWCLSAILALQTLGKGWKRENHGKAQSLESRCSSDGEHCLEAGSASSFHLQSLRSCHKVILLTKGVCPMLHESQHLSEEAEHFCLTGGCQVSMQQSLARERQKALPRETMGSREPDRH